MSVRLSSWLGLVLVLVMAPVFAQASPQVLKVLGRDLVVPSPAGFCTLGTSAIEQQMLEMQRQNTSLAGELAHLAVPCEELKALRAGKADRFKQWVQVLVLRNKGELRLVQATRGQFVQAIAGNVRRSPPDMMAVSKRIDAHLKQKGYGVGIEEPRTTPLGATADALFVEVSMTVTAGSARIPVAAVGAITLANRLPLGVYAYAASDAKGASPAEVIQGYLDGVLRSNP